MNSNKPYICLHELGDGVGVHARVVVTFQTRSNGGSILFTCACVRRWRWGMIAVGHVVFGFHFVFTMCFAVYTKRSVVASSTVSNNSSSSNLKIYLTFI